MVEKEKLIIHKMIEVVPTKLNR